MEQDIKIIINDRQVDLNDSTFTQVTKKNYTVSPDDDAYNKNYYNEIA